jgi:hypothetical protein
MTETVAPLRVTSFPIVSGFKRLSHYPKSAAIQTIKTSGQHINGNTRSPFVQPPLDQIGKNIREPENGVEQRANLRIHSVINRFVAAICQRALAQ